MRTKDTGMGIERSDCSMPAYTPGVKKDQFVIMRDGARLAVDIYRPIADGSFPALLAISPYGKDWASLPALPAFSFRQTGPIEWYVERGYAYIHADARGTGKSEGHFRPLGLAMQDDLYDLVEWIADQPWCTGKVGMIGACYYGAAQWLAAAQQPPRLACIAPCDAFVDPYRDVCYHGGIPSLFNPLWDFEVRARRQLDYPDHRWKAMHPRSEGLARRIAEAPSGTLERAGFHALLRAARFAAAFKPGPMAENTVHTILEHPYDGPPYWISAAYLRFKVMKTPFYSIANLSSVGLHLRGNLLAFEEIDAPKKLLIDGAHGDTDVAPLFEPPDVYPHQQILFAQTEFHQELLRWYDYWLKGLQTGIMDEPTVKYWVRGRERFRTDETWPPRGITYRSVFLKPGPSGSVRSLNDGSLGFAPPDGAADHCSIHYPDPQWTGDFGLGTAVVSASGLPDRIRKILTYTSAPLEADLEIAGPICLQLHASSDQEDTDFCVRLCDQPPVSEKVAGVLEQLDLSPQARVVSRGWLRASHRSLDEQRSKPCRPWHSHYRPEPLEPGRVYVFEIEIWPSAWLFRMGHRIRLEIAPGDSPFFDAPYAHYYGVKMGTDFIHHDAEHPSQLLLPVLPQESQEG